DIFFMANYAQTVNVIGCIKTSKTDASLATTGLVLKLYRKHFGEVPLSASTGPVLDVAAAVSKDGKTLTLAVVNPTMSRIEAPLQVKGARLSGKGILRQIAGKDPMAYNEPGKPPKVSIEEQPVSGVRKKISLAPCSVTLFSLELK
ncbi:MAG: alpha-L-arabinofuranosidase C-terminal domain-containing protein, partial [Planctomycetota bacterium]|nr:alpha-L-arabinofuranosidase C-terminal domain-containing protein [Planctomycetota bacterium]